MQDSSDFRFPPNPTSRAPLPQALASSLTPVISFCLISRRPRMKRGVVVVALLLAGSLSVAVMGFQGPPAGQGAGAGAAGGQRGPAPPAQLTTIKVRDNLYMIANGGGNTAVFVQANGVTLVDTKNPNNGQGILDQVRAVTPKPITMIINTHTHNDHNGSNEFFTDNVQFVAHENTKINMEKMTQF